MLKNPNPSDMVKEIHVMLDADMVKRIEEAIKLPQVKSKTQLVLEGLEYALSKYGK